MIYLMGHYCGSIITGGGTNNLNVPLMVPPTKIVNVEVLVSS